MFFPVFILALLYKPRSKDTPVAAVIFITFATSSAILAATETTATSFITLAVIAAFLAWCSAYYAEEKLHPRIGTVLLTVHNILYVGIIGLVFFFSVSNAYLTGVTFVVSIVLPFALLMYEIEAQQKESTDEEPL
ncbi:hypothetical protein CL630_03585 [bacterium]|nr:hypothetical protein [bacterium]